MKKATMIRDLLKKLNKSFESILRKEFEQFGLTYPQLLVLRQIVDEPKTIGHISKTISLSYSTVSGIIDRLERDGWVLRIRDRDDRRVVWIKKTEKIEETKKQIFRENYYAQLLQELEEEELDRIVHALETLTRQLEKKVEEKS